MEAVYRIPIKAGVDLPVASGTSPTQVGNAAVDWEADPEGKLSTVVLRISGQALKFDDNGTIQSTYPELETFAYRLSNYIANSVLKQTGYDAIDPETVLQKTPEVHPETPDEEREFANRRRTVGTSVAMLYNVRAKFEPNEYPKSFKHSAAVALYADGLRLRSPFQQYELFYKVIEYFFEENGSALDKSVSNHVLPHDARFSESQIEALRHLRNRSIHPRHRKGHINPESVEAISEMEANLHLVRNLADLLLQNPTF